LYAAEVYLKSFFITVSIPNPNLCSIYAGGARFSKHLND